MCRVAGFWDLNYKGDYDMEKTALDMRDSLSYGGPDDAGIYLEKKNGLALGHRRLSVIDLSAAGHQPMERQLANGKSQLMISFNGEIYNYREIRKELEENEYKFKSNSDTEVILAAYEEWGMDCVNKFRGMWAFAIWDKKNMELILCRDRVGVKPLYWYFKDNVFLFASELKAFHKHPKFQKELNQEALPYYFQYGYIPNPLSIFQNTFKLEPGYFLKINQKGEIKKIRYWNPNDFFIKGVEQREGFLKKSEGEIEKELEDILTEAFQLRMVSDVPVGVFLSGGVDSSLVTALLQKSSSRPLQTFTIGFQEKSYDEAPWAKKVVGYLKTDHTEFYCDVNDAKEVIPQLPDLYDEPFGDSSGIPTYLVSKLARKKVTVTLSADGGDEQFGGYTSYLSSQKLAKILNLTPKAARGIFAKVGELGYFWAELAHKAAPQKFKISNFKDKYQKLLSSLNFDNPLDIFNISKSYWYSGELGKLLSAGFKGGNIYQKYLPDRWDKDILNSFMLMDIQTYMTDDILTKVDRATMRVALEGREPLLDNKILEYSLALPSEYKIRNGVSKYLLKKILYKYVPQKLVDRPKQGFGIPIHEWFKADLKNLYSQYLTKEKMEDSGINYELVGENLKNYYAGKPVLSSKLWLILMFEMWKEKWL